MSKFGEIIKSAIPVLIFFHTEWNEQSVSMSPIIDEVATEIGEAATVIKIDVDKNQELADALRIKGLPTLMIYLDQQMRWRNAGEMTKEDIVELIKEQIEWKKSLT